MLLIDTEAQGMYAADRYTLIRQASHLTSQQEIDRGIAQGFQVCSKHLSVPVAYSCYQLHAIKLYLVVPQSLAHGCVQPIAACCRLGR